MSNPSTPSAFQTDIPFTFEDYKQFINTLNIHIYGYPLTNDPADFDSLTPLIKPIEWQISQIYRAKLPRYLLARCPICNASVEEAIDTFSLAGLGWWARETNGFGWFGHRQPYIYEYMQPLAMRIFPDTTYQSECPHVRAVTYGVNFNDIQPNDVGLGIGVVTGSEQPGLLKPFMEQSGTYAVIHTLPIGRLEDPIWQPCYTVYFITYFHPDHQVYLNSLAPQADPYSNREFYWPYNSLDYNLNPWLEKGQLLWLGSKDEDYPLQKRPTHTYPYTNLTGLAGRWYAYYGKLSLLPTQLVGQAIYNPEHPAFKEIKAQEETALQQRQFKV